MTLSTQVSADSIDGDSVTTGSRGTVAEEMLDILLQSKIINESQYQELRTRARQEEQARREEARSATVATATPPVAADKPAWKFKWDNGFKLDRDDGAFKFKFGGRIQLDGAGVFEDRALRNAIGGDGTGVEFRRARLFFEGTAYERLFFKAQYDFANTGDGMTDFKDVYMGLKKLGPVGSVKVGHFKEPFSLEEQTSSKYLTFMERSTMNVFSPSRNVGVAAQNAVLDKRLLWQVGAFRDTNDQGFAFGNKQTWGITGRVSGAPLYNDEGSRVVHLGFGYTHQFRNQNNMLRYRQRPESHLAPRLVDTLATLPADNVDIFNPEFALVLGPFSLQSEFAASLVDNRSTANTDFWGTYVEASYFLTGEHRNYDLGKGRFSRVKPGENFNPSRGDWGAWQLAARYSYLDLNDAFVRGGELSDVTAAVNWYLFPNTRVMLNYIHAAMRDRTLAPNPDLDGDANIVQMRFQVDF